VGQLEDLTHVSTGRSASCSLPPARIRHGLRGSSLSSSTAVARIARISRYAFAAMVPDTPRLISSARYWRTA
jgi:hypothetical protein